jgi:hypothetical protein
MVEVVINNSMGYMAFPTESFVGGNIPQPSINTKLHQQVH